MLSAQGAHRNRSAHPTACATEENKEMENCRACTARPRPAPQLSLSPLPSTVPSESQIVLLFFFFYTEQFSVPPLLPHYIFTLLKALIRTKDLLCIRVYPSQKVVVVKNSTISVIITTVFPIYWALTVCLALCHVLLGAISFTYLIFTLTPGVTLLVGSLTLSFHYCYFYKWELGACVRKIR